MNKRARQYIGLIAAVVAYYMIHEGAHLVYALTIGVFKQITKLSAHCCFQKNRVRYAFLLLMQSIADNLLPKKCLLIC